MNVTRSRWFHPLALVLIVLVLNGACGDDENRFLVAILLSPTTATISNLPPNNTVQFQATGLFSKGPNADLTSTAAWSSSEVGVATVSSSGLVTAVGCGNTIIRAVQSNITGQATVTVC